MATRTIINCGETIKKIIPDLEELKDKYFSSSILLTDWPFSREKLLEEVKELSQYARSAIIQQYNEYIIWNNWPKDSILAPILDISFDKRGLPELVFPYFEPVVRSDNFYQYTDEENLIKLGMFARENNLSFNDVRYFLKEVDELCEEFCLNTEDIIYNLSNVGFNSQYGLCVIDYGLAESDIEKYELVI